MTESSCVGRVLRIWQSPAVVAIVVKCCRLSSRDDVVGREVCSRIPFLPKLIWLVNFPRLQDWSGNMSGPIRRGGGNNDPDFSHSGGMVVKMT